MSDHTINQEEQTKSTDEIIQECQDKIYKSVKVLENNLKGIRTGRASADLFNGISIEIYEGHSPLTHHANISVLDDGRTVKITPWDSSIIGEIKKAISKSELEVTPIVEDKSIKIIIPPLTQERREKLAQLAKSHHTTAKDAINNIRSQYMSLFKKPDKNKSLAEDEKNLLLKKIQNITDKYMEHITNAVCKKREEILKI